jgi:hypothetical protein
MRARWISLFAAVALIAPATAAPAPRSFDLVTFTAPDGFTVDASHADHVAVTRVGTKSYCLIGIYSAVDAKADLDASFAAEWTDIVGHSVDPVPVPATQRAAIGGATAVVGAAMTTSGGKPVMATLATIDAGAKVVSVFVLTPSQDDFKVYTPSIQALLNSMSVRRVEPPAPAPAAPDAPAAPAPAGNGDIPSPDHTLTFAELAGEWVHGEGSANTYVDSSTGVYAGYTSVQYDEKWTITPKGVITDVFHGVSSSSYAGAHGVDDTSTGPATIAKNNMLTIHWGKGKAMQMYLIRAWVVRPDGTTIMKLNGPMYRPSDVDERLFTDRKFNALYDETFIRAPKKK